MKSYIKAIIIFNKNGEKRVVPLEQGSKYNYRRIQNR